MRERNRNAGDVTVKQSHQRGSGFGKLVLGALILVALSAFLWVVTPWSNFGGVRGQSPNDAVGGNSAQTDTRPLRMNVGLAKRDVVIERDGEQLSHFTVEIADTPEAQQIGLMGRTELAPDRGMLFIWEPPTIIAMWMKDTLIPLDFLYIRPNGVIVAIAHNVPPCEPGGLCPAHAAPEPVAYVLELAGGRAKELGLRPGDKLTFVDDEQ